MKSKRITKFFCFFLQQLPSDVFIHDGRPPAVVIDYTRLQLLQIKAKKLCDSLRLQRENKYFVIFSRIRINQ